MRDDDEIEDYEVGYRNPPKGGQFKKGVSGNPSGRPKKASGLGSKVLRELQMPLTVIEKGKPKIITKEEGLAKQHVNRALSGHVPSTRWVDNWRREGLEREAERKRVAKHLANLDARDLNRAQLIEMFKTGKLEDFELE